MSNGLINRQYVGARYVPKIVGEWNKALQYEALSVVTYMGNSFTSKVPVPANSVEINNTDYWVNTANYNAQVAEYKEIVEKEIEDRKNADTEILDNLTDEIKNRKSADTEISNNLTNEINNRNNADIEISENLTKEINNRKSADTEISNNLTNEINNRKNADKDNILWIGDSYSVNYNHKLPNGVRNMLNAKNWYEHSRGGAGFEGAWNGVTFNDLIEEAKNEMTDAQKDMIKYVYIVGGANDSSFTWTAIKPKVISTVANARNSFPNAQVVFIFASSAFNTFSDLYTKTLNMSNDNLVPCIFAMPYYYLTGSFYNDDNVHYTEAATNYIISVISNLICGSSYIPTVTINNSKSCFMGWTAINNQLQFSAPTGELRIRTPYLSLTKSTEEAFETDEYGNTILLKSIPISNENRNVIPLRSTRIFVQLKIKGVIYTDFLECSLDNTAHQLMWTTDKSYPATKDMIIKIIA